MKFSSLNAFIDKSLCLIIVQVKFPNNKSVKVASGSNLKDAAAKAGFSPNYGCEEGKCG